jgi:hypothetical protein
MLNGKLAAANNKANRGILALREENEGNPAKLSQRG